MEEEVRLSILIPTIPSRRTRLSRLLSKLERQTKDYDDIEVLCLYDNKRMNVGQKRNALLRLVRGGRFVFIDDDDDITNTYISTIYKTIQDNPADLITFDVRYSDNLGNDYICDYSKGERPPAHIHVWLTDKFKEVLFPEVNAGEDMRWVKECLKRLDSTYHIPQVLYHYRFNSNTTETQL